MGTMEGHADSEDATAQTMQPMAEGMSTVMVMSMVTTTVPTHADVQIATKNLQPCSAAET